MKLKKYIKLALPVALAITFVFAGIAMAASVTIDTFVVEPVDIQASSSTITATHDSNTNTAILGDERDSYVEWQSGASNVRLLIDFNDSDQLEFQVGSGVHGKAIVTWDGDDADSGTTLDLDGLGGIDLVDSTNDGIVINVNSWDNRDIDITVTIYSNTNSSEAILQLRGDEIDTETPFGLSFSDDFTTASGSGADFTDVGAIQMEIQTIDTGADVALNVTLIDPTRDFGDLPDTYSNTLLTDSGARHTIGSIYLGSSVDSELDGVESSGATGDDVADGDDEDGVTIVGTDENRWQNGTDGGAVAITHSAPGDFKLACVNGWIDWNEDNDFDDADEFVVNQQIVSGAGRRFSFDVPADTFGETGPYTVTLNSRWRIYPNTGGNIRCTDEPAVSVTGYVSNGEVEDYQWRFDGPTAITLLSLTAEPNRSPMWITAIGITGLVVGIVILLFNRRRKV